MTARSALVIGVLTLSSVAMARTKSYSVNLSEPVTVHNTQLAPGDYKVTIEGSNAVFDDTQKGTSYTLPVKVESAPKKFDVTSMDTVREGDSNNLTSISLGGSNTKLDFMP